MRQQFQKLFAIKYANFGPQRKIYSPKPDGSGQNLRDILTLARWNSVSWPGDKAGSVTVAAALGLCFTSVCFTPAVVRGISEWDQFLAVSSPVSGRCWCGCGGWAGDMLVDHKRLLMGKYVARACFCLLHFACSFLIWNVDPVPCSILQCCGFSVFSSRKASSRLGAPSSEAALDSVEAANSGAHALNQFHSRINGG